MQRNQIIKLAEEAGLLFNKDVAPYNTPTQQRLIAKLEKFVKSVLEEENSMKNPMKNPIRDSE